MFRDGALAGHVALVTGGGTGICRGIAAAYARLGADVCIVSRKPDVLDATARELSAQTGAHVIGVAADVRDPDAIGARGRSDRRAVRQARHARQRRRRQLPRARRRRCRRTASSTVIDIDLVGTFNASRAAFEALQQAGDGAVLNISATLHYHGTPLQIHASAAKAGVDAVTKNLAVEWGRFGIRVCGIAPGPIGDTEGMRRLAPGDITDKATRRDPRGPVRRDRRDRRGRGVPALARRPRTSPGTCSSSTAATASRRRRSASASMTGADARALECPARRAARSRVASSRDARRSPRARRIVRQRDPRSRAVAIELVAGRGHYERVIAAVLGAHTSVWIATANVKELMVEDGRARPGRRRVASKTARTSRCSRGSTSSPRAASSCACCTPSCRRGRSARRSRSTRGSSRAASRCARCPRVHLKAVIVDGELLYLGSANWTGAGLGAKGSGRRNFELGIVTDDGAAARSGAGALRARVERRRVRAAASCATCARARSPTPPAPRQAKRSDSDASCDATCNRRRGSSLHYLDE